VKPRDITCALAALALAVCASGCADGDSVGVPVTRPFPPLGTEPSPVTGAEPTTGGDDPLPQAEVSIQTLCAAACTRLENECPAGVASDCASSCTSLGLSSPGCAAPFRAVVACITTAPLICYGMTVGLPDCEQAQNAFSDCLRR